MHSQLSYLPSRSLRHRSYLLLLLGRLCLRAVSVREDFEGGYVKAHSWTSVCIFCVYISVGGCIYKGMSICMDLHFGV